MGLIGNLVASLLPVLELDITAADRVTHATHGHITVCGGRGEVRLQVTQVTAGGGMLTGESGHEGITGKLDTVMLLNSRATVSAARRTELQPGRQGSQLTKLRLYQTLQTSTQNGKLMKCARSSDEERNSIGASKSKMNRA